MITIINGTNRSENLSQVVSQFYQEELTQQGAQDLQYLSMEDIPEDMVSALMFTPDGRSASLTQWQEDVIIPSDKIVFILPEYNGGIPGILKLFIDACSSYKREECFSGKKVAMLGVAAGRAGNLRGMDHLTSVMNYLGAIVMPNKLPISSIHTLIDQDRQLVDQDTKSVISNHAKAFLEF